MTALRQRMIEDMLIRNLAPMTQSTYLRHVTGFARYFHRSPKGLGATQIREYQIWMWAIPPDSLAGTGTGTECRSFSLPEPTLD